MCLLGIRGKRHTYTIQLIPLSISIAAFHGTGGAAPAMNSPESGLHVCSGCSGDDPRPEEFASFDVSSPKTGRSFASGHMGKRRLYGTRASGAYLTNAALLLSILRVHDSAPRSLWPKRCEQGKPVNLNLRGDFRSMSQPNTPRKAREYGGSAKCP